jgi:hypothetical protein
MKKAKKAAKKNITSDSVVFSVVSEGKADSSGTPSSGNGTHDPADVINGIIDDIKDCYHTHDSLPKSGDEVVLGQSELGVDADHLEPGDLVTFYEVTVKKVSEYKYEPPSGGSFKRVE